MHFKIDAEMAFIHLERYEMIRSHLRQEPPTLEPPQPPNRSHSLTITIEQDDDFDTLEVSCVCGWWDHWTQALPKNDLFAHISKTINLQASGIITAEEAYQEIEVAIHG